MTDHNVACVVFNPAAATPGAETDATTPTTVNQPAGVTRREATVGLEAEALDFSDETILAGLIDIDDRGFEDMHRVGGLEQTRVDQSTSAFTPTEYPVRIFNTIAQPRSSKMS